MVYISSKTIALPAVVDLDALDPIRDELIEALDSGPVTLTCAGVERVATNALLMFLSAAETARQNHFAFAVAEPSEPFRAAVGRLGLGAQFAAIMEG